jgi:hypothetical protein
MTDRTFIAREARRIARIYAPVVGWRQARIWGIHSARCMAGDIAAGIARDAAMSPAARAARNEAIAVQCWTDGPLSNAALARLDQLSRIID